MDVIALDSVIIKIVWSEKIWIEKVTLWFYPLKKSRCMWFTKKRERKMRRRRRRGRRSEFQPSYSCNLRGWVTHLETYSSWIKIRRPFPKLLVKGSSEARNERLPLPFPSCLRAVKQVAPRGWLFMTTCH